MQALRNPASSGLRQAMQGWDKGPLPLMSEVPTINR
jgi:hypothetical protein